MAIFSQAEKKQQLVEQTLLENYDRYYRLAYSYVKSTAEAEDIVQNGAYQAILNSEKLMKREYVKTWLYRIMLNETFKVLQQPRYVSLDEVPIEQGTEDKYENLDLWRAIEELSREDQAVLRLRYFEDLKLGEIAGVLGENVSTVKSRLYRATKKLKISLSDEDIW